MTSAAGAAARALYAAAGAATGAALFARSVAANVAGADPDEAAWLRERRGLWAGHTPDPWIWIHGASAGEAEIAVAVARALAARAASIRIVITSTTRTGRARVLREDRFESRVFPIDYAPFVRRLLMPSAPGLFVAVETEIWPETMRVLLARRVPVAFVNARISDRSLPRYRRLAPLLAPLLGRVSRVCARDDEAASRWRLLGVPDDRIAVTGNIKLDVATMSEDAETSPLFAREAGRPLLLAASTHEGEDEVAVDAFVAVRSAVPGARLIVAPRHIERAAAVAEIVRSKGLSVTRYGADAGAGPSPLPPEDVVVIDRFGLLSRAYAAADAAFVGGSLVAGPGGHNLLEPAMASCPVAAGPHLENVPDQRGLLLRTGALAIVENVEQLRSFWLDALDRPALFREALESARSAIRARRGALERTVAELVRLLPAGVASAHGERAEQRGSAAAGRGARTE